MNPFKKHNGPDVLLRTSTGVVIQYEGKEPETLPLIKVSREEARNIIKEETIKIISHLSPKEIYKNINHLNEFVIDDYTFKVIRNYELEYRLVDITGNLGYVIDELCPFNGVCSSYGSINNLN